MPTVSSAQLASAHGRTQRPQAGQKAVCARPSIRAATAREKQTEKPTYPA